MHALTLPLRESWSAILCHSVQAEMRHMCMLSDADEQRHGTGQALPGRLQFKHQAKSRATDCKIINLLTKACRHKIWGSNRPQA